MSLSLFLRKAAVFCALFLALPGALFAQSSYTTNGGEYAIAGLFPGDQVHPGMSLGPSGGYLVWEDNITDGDGLGVSAIQLGVGSSAVLSSFRVNQQGAGDQERPQVSVLNGGGAVFVWQGGQFSYQHIYARFLTPSNTWATGDIMVNSSTNFYQISPVVATLKNGNVVVLWSSFDQQAPDSMQDVYGQLFSPTGQKIGQEFPVNQFTSYNQRTPSVAALPGGGFVVAWVSELERSGPLSGLSNPVSYSTNMLPSIDIYARMYDANASPLSNEFLVNTDFNTSADPSIAVNPDGGFLIAWSRHDVIGGVAGWDVYARTFSSAGVGLTDAQAVNYTLVGDQYGPRVSALGNDYMVVWTSLYQDGSYEGVYGRFLNAAGSPISDEMRVNTTTLSKQIHPTVASDGNNQFLVVWSSFMPATGMSFDLFAQRYAKLAAPLAAMDAPFVHAPFVVADGAYQPELAVSWPIQAGLPIDHYEVFVDGASEPAASVSTNVWVMTAADGLTANSTHSFKVAYVTADGSRSPLSPPATGTTWSGTAYAGVLPVEWMAQYYGWGSQWPSPTSPLISGVPTTLLDVFRSGGNPQDASTWLRTALVPTSEGLFLTWNPHRGRLYQVQSSTNLSSWTNVGPPRFAAENSDSIFVGLTNSGAYYHVVQLR